MVMYIFVRHLIHLHYFLWQATPSCVQILSTWDWFTKCEINHVVLLSSFLVKRPSINYTCGQLRKHVC